MKNKILGTVLLAGACFSSAWATDMGVIDVQAVFRDSTQVKKINADLEKQFAPQKKDLQAMNTKLQDEIKDLNKNGSVMDDAKKNALKSSIQAQGKALHDKQMKFQQDLFTAQNTAMTKFMKQVQGTVAKVAKSKGLDIVVAKNAVLYSKDKMDVTSIVLKKVN